MFSFKTVVQTGHFWAHAKARLLLLPLAKAQTVIAQLTLLLPAHAHPGSLLQRAMEGNLGSDQHSLA